MLRFHQKAVEPSQETDTRQLSMCQKRVATGNGKRMPVVLVVDESLSMNPVETELNNNAQFGFDTLSEDPLVAVRAWIAVIGFGHEVRMVRPFGPPRVGERIQFVCSGRSTALWQAVLLAIKMVEEETARIKADGRDFYPPMIVTLGDGVSMHEPLELKERAKSELRRVQLRGRQGIRVVPYVFGPKADRQALTDLFGCAPKEVEGAWKFAEVFEWITTTITRVTSGESIDSADRQVIDEE